MDIEKQIGQLLIDLAVPVITIYGATVAHKIIAFLEQKKKASKALARNQHLDTLLRYADQAVNFVENSKIDGPEKKQQAQAFITNRISHAGLAGVFTSELISAEIERSVQRTNEK